MSNYETKEIKLTDVLSDSTFNCRGEIAPLDVLDLAKDIERNELQFPIIVQPWDKEEYKYRIIAGHRRFAAFKVLKRDAIPAMVKHGLSEVQASLLNLNENLKRKDLNILEEARAVARLYRLGLTQDIVALELNMSRSWVQVRVALLDLPGDIQKEASLGHLNQYQIKQLAAMRTKDQQYEAVQKIKNAKLRGERGVDVGKKPHEQPFKKKRRSKTQVQEMIDHLIDSLGYGLHVRTLAWANGEINSVELFLDIKHFAKENGVGYKMPLNLEKELG